MDLHRVAVFAKVVEDGGFTAAARSLGLPKSSVSRAVSLLEEELGSRLLRRTTRSVALTEAGAAFYERASRGLAAIDEAREAVVELEAEIRGPIRITAPVDAGAWMLAPIVAAFVARHPGVTIEAVLTGRVVDLVEEGMDLAFRAGGVGDDRLVARRLPAVGAGIYGSPAYLAAHGIPRTIADLADHQCVLFRAPRGRATWTLQGPHGEEKVEVRGPISADDFAFTAQAIVAGGGLGFVPEFVARHAPAGSLQRVLPAYELAGAPFHLVYAAGRYLPRRVAVLRDFVVEQLAAPAPTPRKRR